MTSGRVSASRRILSVFALIFFTGSGFTAPAHAVLFPPHDNRADARSIESLPYTDYTSTLLATNELGEPSPCGEIGATVWYTYTADSSNELKASTVGSDFDTVLAAYESTNPNESIACSDDAYEVGGPSEIHFSIEAGKTYHFQAGGWRSDFGNLEFNVSIASLPPPPPPAPANDSISDAIQISELPFVHDVNIAGATTVDEPQHCNSRSTVWYSYTATSTQELVADFDAVTYYFQPTLVLYDAANLSSYIACADGTSYDARLRFMTTPGTTYLFQAGSTDEVPDYGGLGSFSLKEVLTPGFDDRSDALIVTSLPFEHETDTREATVEQNEYLRCGFRRNTVWYQYTSPIDQSLEVDTRDSNFDTGVAVYDSQDFSRPLTCNDNLDTTQGRVEFTALAGETYYIQVGGGYWGFGWAGSLTLRIRQTSAGLPPDPVWPDINAATIRPGVKLYISGQGWCTSNFVFQGTGRRQGRIYIGTAGHCPDAQVGMAVHLPPDDDTSYFSGDVGPVIGSVVYSSWAEDNEFNNDFALVEILSSRYGEVHPAVTDFGGPTGIVDFADVEIGDKVMSFGNSPLRPGPRQLDRREGYVTRKAAPYTIYANSANPGVFGDSGSDALLGDGRALGIVVTIAFDPPASNGIASLSEVLRFASGLGWEVKLQTWDLLDPGLFPRLPGH